MLNKSPAHAKEHAVDKELEFPDYVINPDFVNTTDVERFSVSSSGPSSFPTPGWVSCHTTWASPTFTEVNYLIAKIATHTGWNDCTQKNMGGSKCTKLDKYYGGAISFCGKHDITRTCSMISTAAQKVRDHCSIGYMHRAGGVFKFNTSTQGFVSAGSD